MPLRLTANGETVINNKRVVTYSSITINGNTLSDVVDFTSSNDRRFGASSLQFVLKNSDGKYGINGPSQIKYGDVIVLYEGLYNSIGVIEQFAKFTGIVRHIVPSSSSEGHYIQITAQDKLVKLEDTDVDKLYQSTDAQISAMPSETIGGVILMESWTEVEIMTAVGLTDTYIEVSSVDGIETAFYGNGCPAYIYIGSVTAQNKYQAISVDTVNNRIYLAEYPRSTYAVGTKVRQRLSDSSTKSGQAYYFDFGYWDSNISDFPLVRNGTTIYFHAVQNISPMKLPQVRIMMKSSQNTLKDPGNWNGFSINYATGQVILGSGLDIQNYEMWATFFYYPTSTIQYGEDIIENLLLELDGYGNSIFTSADIATTLLIENGVATDLMDFNRTPVTINGTTYPIGQVWYHTFSNITSVLSPATYLIGVTPGVYPTNIANIDNRYGRIILQTVPSVLNQYKGYVKYTASYSFKTIQATGVRIPILDLRQDVVKTRFEAFGELKKQLAPNYIIKIAGDGKVWGKHLRQNTTQDYDLILTQSLEYDTDTEIYTRVRLLGENATPVNVLNDATYDTDGTYTVYASNQTLVWTGEDIASFTGYPSGWKEFTVPDSLVDEGSIGRILTEPTPPVVWINGLKNSTTAIDNVPFEAWGYDQNSDVYKGFWFNLAIDKNSPIIFYVNGFPYSFELNNNVVNQCAVMDLNLQWDSENFVYKWNPLTDPAITDKSYWGSDLIANISSITFNLSYNNAWQYMPTAENTNRFAINQQFLVLNDETQTYVDKSRKVPPVFGMVGGGYTAISTINYSGGWTPLNPTPPTYYGQSNYLCDGRKDRMCQVYAKDMTDANANNNYAYIDIELEGFGLIKYIELWANENAFGYDVDTGNGIAHISSGMANIWIDYWSESQNQWRPLMKDGQRAMGIAIERVSSDQLYTNTTRFRWTCDWCWTDKIRVRMGATRLWNVGSVNPNFTMAFSEWYVYCIQQAFNVTADFWYQKEFTTPSPDNIKKLHDGLWTTQLQSIYQFQPINGHRLVTFNIPQVVENGQNVYPLVEAIDIVGGWFIPNPNDSTRKYDISNTYTIEYWDGYNWYPVATDSSNFQLGSGETKSFERSNLGNDFRPQKLSIVVNKVQLLEGFGTNKYVVPLVEFSAWRNISLTGEAKLIRSTKNTSPTTAGDNTVNVQSTSGFAAAGSAYFTKDGIATGEKFSYTSKNATQFLGCTWGFTPTGNYFNTGAIVSANPNFKVNNQPTYWDVYDPDYLLDRYGDKLYKDLTINKYLNTQTKLDSMAYQILRELIKNVTTVSTPVLCRPDMIIGDTVGIYDAINAQNSPQIYFVDSVQSRNGMLSVRLAKYWSIDQEDSK